MPGRNKAGSSRRKAARQQKRTRGVRGLKKGLLIISFALCCLLFVVLGKKLYFAWKNQVWIPNTRLTVVVASANPTIYSLDPETGRVVKLVIPQNTQVESSFGYGSNWLAGSLWRLGEQEGKNGELLQNTVQKSFGMPVDAWIGASGEALFDSSHLSFISAYFAALSAGRAKTNLTFFDRVKLKMAMQNRNIKALDIQTLGGLKKTKLSDGMVGYVIVPEKVKTVLEPLRDDTVFSEGKKLTIVNSTSKAGLALQVAQVSTNLGLQVINTKNSQEAGVDDCLIKGLDTDLQTISARRLVQVFNCTIQVSDSGAGELELVLGEKFAKRF